MLKKLSIQSKLMLMLLVVCITSILAIAYIGYNSGQQALNRSIFNQLISLRESKAYQIETYFKNIRSQVQTISQMPSVVDSMRNLSQAYQELQKESIQVNWSQKLKDYYDKEFLPRLQENVEGRALLFSYLPSQPASRYLQYYYIANNFNPVGKKYYLTNPQDGSKYSQIHQKIQSVYRNFIVEFGYHDLFLIDIKTGDIVYSVSKETDYATNIYTGPYARSNLGTVVKEVYKGNHPGVVIISDFAPYRPSYAAPTAFIGSPIFDKDQLIGVLAFQISVDEINRVMTGNNNWRRDGLGDSGEIYLIGSDYGMRSVSRFFVEDPEQYLKVVEANGLPKKEIEKISRLKTSILLQQVTTVPAEKALDGKAGIDITLDYRGVMTLSSYRLLDIDGLDWAIIAQIDRDEAFAPIKAFQKNVLLSTAIIVLLVTAIASCLSYYFVQPIRVLIDGFRKVGAGQTNIAIKIKSQDEFSQLANSFNEMVDNLERQKSLIEEKNQENEKLLLSILPEPVAQRLKGGEESIADSFPNVTVMFADLPGFTELSQQLSANETVNFLNDLIIAFDEAAETYGVEKVKTIGSGYMAVSGLSVPRIDHTKRVVDFAIEMVRILHSFNRDRNTNLKIRIGINSGEVIAGIVGRSKFIYDLWGDTVNIAYRLQSRADSEKICVTDTVRTSLADIYDFQSVTNLEIPGKSDLVIWSISF